MMPCKLDKLITILLISVILSCSDVMEKKEYSMPEYLAAYPVDKPEEPMDLLFFHHSCGGQLLADKGESREMIKGTRIYASHPNGGGLKTALRSNNYLVHEASYRSAIGEETDICHWNLKFRDHMKEILGLREQDELHANGKKNRIVIFKSCFPNSLIDSEGTYPGNPDSCERSTANYKAAFSSLLPYFSREPETLFIYFTSPPMDKPACSSRQKAVSAFMTLIGKPDPADAAGRRIRSFNNWITDKDNGWLKGYGLRNVVVFDYYDILTSFGRSDWSVYASQGGRDSHPSSEGNERAAEAFIPFINKAVKRMGL